MAGPRLLREESNLHAPHSQGWSNWKKAMVPEEKIGYTQNRGRNQEGFIWKNILDEGFIPRDLCGIYEWRTIRQGQPKRAQVVYVGSTCRRHGTFHWLQNRILGYCSTGNHKTVLINEALRRGYTLEVRCKVANNEEDAKTKENELLEKYNYAWNIRKNGLRDILPY